MLLSPFCSLTVPLFFLYLSAFFLVLEGDVGGVKYLPLDWLRFPAPFEAGEEERTDEDWEGDPEEVGAVGDGDEEGEELEVGGEGEGRLGDGGWEGVAGCKTLPQTIELIIAFCLLRTKSETSN